MTTTDWIQSNIGEVDGQTFSGFGSSESAAERKQTIEESRNEIEQLRSDVSAWASDRIAELEATKEGLPDREPNNPDANTMKDTMEERIQTLKENPESVVAERENLLLSRVETTVIAEMTYTPPEERVTDLEIDTTITNNAPEATNGN